MTISASPSPQESTTFKSPPHALLRAARLGRQRWKNKAQERRRRLKTLTNEVAALRRSRQHWKDLAGKLRQQNNALQARLHTFEQSGLPAPNTEHHAQSKKARGPGLL